MLLKEFITKKIGVDKAIFFTLLSRGLQAGTAFFTIFFIAKNLSPEEQGFYYTFGSIVAIQVFFELGLTGIITQFVAHEAVHLRFNERFEIEGEDSYKSRLSSLLRFCAKWYFVLACLIFATLGIVGYVFFSKYSVEHKDVQWFLPWMLLSVGTAMNLLIAPIISFLEGLGKVKEVAQMRLAQQIAYPIIVWGGVSVGSKLFVSGADAIMRVFVLVFMIYKFNFFKILKSIWLVNQSEQISYMKEIFPYQWRIALSWISGYFVFQLFNPVLFATEGAKVAGQMGMTIMALNGIQALTLSWMNTKVPRLSGYIAVKDYLSLDSLFRKTMRPMLLVGTCLLCFFVGFIYLVKARDVVLLGTCLGDRFLPMLPLCLMAWATWTNIPINGWAIYLRCHKKEPLLVNSVVMGILCCASTFVFGTIYGLYGIVFGYALLRIVSLTWIHYTFVVKREQWHNAK